MPDDHDGDHPTPGRDHPPTGTEPVSVGEAARRLRISRNAVVQRRKRGTLFARNDGGTWLYWIPATAGVVGRDHPRPDTDQPPPTGATTPTDHPATGDISSLVGLVDRLVRENADLHATAAVLQERNRVLSERVLALESGVRTPDRQETAAVAGDHDGDTAAAGAVVQQEPPAGAAVVVGDARNAGGRGDDTRDPSPGFWRGLWRTLSEW